MHRSCGEIHRRGKGEQQAVLSLRPLHCATLAVTGAEKDIAKYHGRYDQGWDAVRDGRYQRMVERGVVRSVWGLSQRDPGSLVWESEAQKAMMSQRMEVYAAQVDALDQGVGRILSALEHSGKRENTVVMFLSDNGCSAEGGQKGFNNPQRGEVNAELGTRDSYVSAGLSWANACNTPYRKYKMQVHEGGISTPLIVSWPRGFSNRRGELEHSVGHVIDLMPTCIELAGARYDTAKAIPLEGISLVSVVTGEAGAGTNDERVLCWEHEGNRAVRRGRWKLVASNKDRWELYDLEADRTEQTNLATAEPDVVAELRSLYEAWAERCGVKPWPIKQAKR
ncbi:MAG: sulfatase-like hydrolase/transferase [Verrucomicrobiales bacterium]